jgi:hypothetical protein
VADGAGDDEAIGEGVAALPHAATTASDAASAPSLRNRLDRAA